MVRSTLLQAWKWAALKGGSGGITVIVVETWRFFDFLTWRNRKRESQRSLRLTEGRWFHICFCFFCNSTICDVLEAFLARIWGSFWERCDIFMKSIEWHRGGCFIVLSVNFYGYKRLQHWIQFFFRTHDFSDLVFLISLMICFLNGHSEYYK